MKASWMKDVFDPQDSSGMRLWKRKWFVLSDFCLFYYKGESSLPMRSDSLEEKEKRKRQIRWRIMSSFLWPHPVQDMQNVSISCKNAKWRAESMQIDSFRDCNEISGFICITILHILLVWKLPETTAFSSLLSRRVMSMSVRALLFDGLNRFLSKFPKSKISVRSSLE